MPEIIVIAHNIRSTFNIGSIVRTCDGFGVRRIILSGYSPYPAIQNDNRLPHIAQKLHQQIHKTALGAEEYVDFEYCESPDLTSLKNAGYQIVALEQSPSSIPLREFQPKDDQKIALLIGEEVHGITPELLAICDTTLEIPMHGQKESFNVSVATAIALYQLTI
jgi:23S rRNA (guanosine2251-2'-O)-methyltransferase